MAAYDLSKDSPLRHVAHGFVFVLFYLVLANARSIQPNPLIPGATMAVAIVVPAIAGLLSGRWTGLATGIISALAAAVIFALVANSDAHRAASELLSVIPYGIMGWTAGWLRSRLPSPLPACALLLGHLLKLSTHLLAGRLSVEHLASPALWLGLAWETLLGIAVVTAVVGIFRFGLERRSS